MDEILLRDYGQFQPSANTEFVIDRTSKAKVVAMFYILPDKIKEVEDLIARNQQAALKRKVAQEGGTI